ncbi:MAG: HEPN domain-containing protein [Chloroflexi bacterium]|nr:HEPN domain-containing protein [Chloroflexota bacterium]
MSVRPPPDSPAAWLERARSDLQVARTVLGVAGVLPEDACFHAQQCAEKALNALLLGRGLAMPRTHVLETLLDLLIATGLKLPMEVDDAYVLTEYAVQIRYPAVRQPVTEPEAAS